MARRKLLYDAGREQDDGKDDETEVEDKPATRTSSAPIQALDPSLAHLS